jgi:hypothetical protein
MRCANLTDDQLWRAIAQNTEKLSALIHQQLELDGADERASIHRRVSADLIRFARNFQREYRQYADELRRRYPVSDTDQKPIRASRYERATVASSSQAAASNR